MEARTIPRVPWLVTRLSSDMNCMNEVFTNADETLSFVVV